MVIPNNVIKYITNIGQKTGILKQSKNVQIVAITVDFVTEYQNLNSGNLLIKGRNSSLARVGNSGPPSSNHWKKYILLHTYITYHYLQVITD